MPYVVVNLKAYPEAAGDAAERLATTAGRIAEETGITFIICPMAQDILRTAPRVTTWAQDADPVEPGAHTGSLTLEGLAAAGARGTLLNHAECRRTFEEVMFLVERAGRLGMQRCICVRDPAESSVFAPLGPEFIAVEPPELIGGDVSVTSADPDVVRGGVEAVHSVSKGIRVLCGAGIRSGRDMEVALELGADGVLLASGVVRSPDPEVAMREIISRI